MSKLFAATILILALALGACEKPEPFDYSGFDKRPGLFTGKDGVYVIYLISPLTKSALDAGGLV